MSSTLWEGSVAQKLLFKLINLDIEIFSSIEILSEYKKVLKRDFDYSNEEIISIIEKLFAFIKIITTKDRLEVIKDDSEDNKILECAVASSSNYIITYDKHLLNIKKFQNIKIIKPEELIKLI